ncbi:scavenger receptor cysteine-rich type 1 protein M130-like [Acipenser ruthenus]|uniref:scavenger receptor cysteine-rich type 1 protein M130-like n=1 Tax=Acipenser ruthenus TaxID=7906 RepID=UPI0027426442|nr:scavenger receptor cysteine-rich type 1 protein M130-like [Acipenser ruthenus]
MNDTKMGPRLKRCIFQLIYSAVGIFLEAANASLNTAAAPVYYNLAGVNGGVCAGILQVSSPGKEGLVCYESMDSDTARKVCADLRCGKFIELLGHNLDERETGSRTTWNLMRQNMSDPILRPAVCVQRKVTQVRCQNLTHPLMIRVKGNAFGCAGRVEVNLYGGDGYWEPVCSREQWDWERASEVCRSVGCGRVKEFQAGGIENNRGGVSCPRGIPLSNCRADLKEESSCRPAEIICEVPASSLPVRLSESGAARCSGIVEVSLSGSWRGLCGGQGWSLETASVICRELNCQEALEIQPARIGNDKEIQGVSCPENKTIRQCHDHLEERRCTPVRLICNSSSPELAFTLTDGRSKCAGNASVFYDGTFQPVCRDSWSEDAASTACRQLNCGRAKTISADRYAKVRSGLQCGRNHTRLEDCWHFLEKKSCSQAMVICTGHKEVIESKAGQIVRDVICYILSAVILIMIAIKCGPRIYKKLRKKVFRKNEREWIGPTQSQSVSFHRSRNALQPSPRPPSGPNTENEYTTTPTPKRHSPAYPALERMLVNVTSENSSAGNSEYDFY